VTHRLASLHSGADQQFRAHLTPCSSTSASRRTPRGAAHLCHVQLWARQSDCDLTKSCILHAYVLENITRHCSLTALSRHERRNSARCRHGLRPLQLVRRDHVLRTGHHRSAYGAGWCEMGHPGPPAEHLRQRGIHHGDNRYTADPVPEMDAAPNIIRGLALMCKSPVRSAGILAGIMLVTFSHMGMYAVVFGAARGRARKDPRAGQPEQYRHQLQLGFRHHYPPALVSLVITTIGMVLCYLTVPLSWLGVASLRDCHGTGSPLHYFHGAATTFHCSVTEDDKMCCAVASRMTPRWASHRRHGSATPCDVPHTTVTTSTSQC
jgi:hypothetical protein